MSNTSSSETYLHLNFPAQFVPPHTNIKGFPAIGWPLIYWANKRRGFSIRVEAQEQWAPKYSTDMPNLPRNSNTAEGPAMEEAQPEEAGINDTAAVLGENASKRYNNGVSIG
eukprot:scaffold7566_cov64-Attheya_sp.AAC.2